MNREEIYIEDESLKNDMTSRNNSKNYLLYEKNVSYESY